MTVSIFAYRFHHLKPVALGLATAAFPLLLAAAEERRPDAAAELSDRDIVGPYIAAALVGNPELQAAETRYRAALRTIDSAGALPDPKVQLTHFVESVQTRTGPQRQALSLQQPLPWFGKRGTKRQAARHQSEALWHAYARQQLTLADAISQQALEVAFLDKALSITQQNTALLRRLETIVENKVKAGGALSDLLKLQVEISRFEDTLALQKTQRTVALATLQSLLGGSAASLPVAADWQAPAFDPADEQAWLDAILGRSPQLAMLRALAQSQEAKERLARFASKPDLTLGLNYIRTGDPPAAAAPDSGKDPWAIMVGVSLPIWSKANHAIALQASLESEAMEAEIRGLELKLVARGETLLAQLADSQARVRRYQGTLLPLARQAQEISVSSYQSGKASILELIDSERALLTLETEYWRAAADAWQARWSLATLAGGLWLP
mgnify:CR=1 FL=1